MLHPISLPVMHAGHITVLLHVHTTSGASKFMDTCSFHICTNVTLIKNSLRGFMILRFNECDTEVANHKLFPLCSILHLTYSMKILPLLTAG
jgi:hypothetical protein